LKSWYMFIIFLTQVTLLPLLRPMGCEWMVCDGASLLWAEFEEQEAKENTDNDQDKDN